MIEMSKEQVSKFQEQYKGLSMQKQLDFDFMKLLQSPAVPYLTEKKVGNHEIKIEIVPAEQEMVVVSMRNWLMMGYKPLKVKFTEPRLVYKLFKDKQMLMSDSPQELFLQYEAYKNAKGKVLMGGLGLGMSANLFANKNEVTSVTVIEIDKDVIKLCKPTHKKIKVINQDIWEYLKNTNEKFDYIYIDIHYSTGCMEYIKTVLPMRELLSKKFPNVLSDFWGEEEMKSQYDSNYKKESGV